MNIYCVTQTDKTKATTMLKGQNWPRYSMVFNKDPIEKEKAIEKTHIHSQGLKHKWYQVMFFIS